MPMDYSIDNQGSNNVVKGVFVEIIPLCVDF